jgi:polyisoprenyl-teichoic acid--peptidoglycan teichoic acid transferase
MSDDDEVLSRLESFSQFLGDPSGELPAQRSRPAHDTQSPAYDAAATADADVWAMYTQPNRMVAGDGIATTVAVPALTIAAPDAELAQRAPLHNERNAGGSDLNDPPAEATSPPSLLRMLRPVALPGSTLVRSKPITAALLLVAGVWAPIVAAAGLFMIRDRPSQWLLNPKALRAMVAVAAAAIISRLIAVWLDGRYADPAHRRRVHAAGFAAVTALAIPTTYVAITFEQVGSAVDDVFASDPLAGPIAVAPDDPTAPQFQTVLLLGGDEGPGRFGLRTDTMILMTLHHDSGRISMISIPRNLEDVQFPPESAMHDRYPDGFDDLANAIYPTVYADEELSAAYARDGLEPGAVALMEGLSYSLHVTIDDYALVNMVGFIDVIDALGGIPLEVETKLPMPGNPPGAKRDVPPTIGPGLVRLDGTLALGFVRSRASDSDYERMGRQRQLLTALAQSTSVTDVLTRFGELSDSLRTTIRTSMTVDEAKALLGVIELQADALETTGLVPPLLEPSAPDYDAVSALIDQLRQAMIDGVAQDAVLAPLLPLPTTP